jgi:TANFOR domain-containing protein
MCTDYKQLRSRFLNLKSVSGIVLLALSIVLFPIKSDAQIPVVSVNVTVMPPYTSSLYDYINTPNKIMVTLMHTQLDYPDLEIYLKASITSENGIKITTEEGYKPAEPIFLGRGKSYILNNQNIGEAFNLDHTIIEGTTLSELLNGAGLPEDYYQICIQVFDFNTDQLLSGNEPIGCSNQFNISNLEPPIITNPFTCGEPVIPSATQMVQISWTIPSGSMPGTVYNFEMVEIPDYSTINPNEAFETSAFPPFYEESTKISSVQLSIQKVLLTQGYSYAFRVKAEDPTGKMHYRNNGYSEVCSFIYGTKPDLGDMGDKQVQFISPKDCSADSVLIAMPPEGFYTGWRILPFYKDNYKDPLENLPGYEFRVEFFDDEFSDQAIYTSTTEKTFFQADPISDNLPFVSGQPYWIEVSIENTLTLERILSSGRCGFRYIYSPFEGAGLTSKTVSGNLQYQFENQGSASYPVANSEVRLKCIYLLNDTTSQQQFEIPEATVISMINSTKSFPANLTTTPIASTVTSNSGNFSFHYSWFENAPLGEVDSVFHCELPGIGMINGSLERAMRLEIISPYYTSPQTVIVSNSPVYDMGEVNTFVYSYTLKAELSKGYKNKEGFTEDLVGSTIYIFRKNKLPGIPQFEGDRLSKLTIMNSTSELKASGYYLVASEKAIAGNNDNGDPVAIAAFQRLIENLVTGDEYYWYAEGTSLGSAQPLVFSNNFESNVSLNTTTTSVNQTGNVGSSAVGDNTTPQGSTSQGYQSQTYLFLDEQVKFNNDNSQSTGVQHSYTQSSNAPLAEIVGLDNNQSSFNNGIVNTGTSTLETHDVKYTTTGRSCFNANASLNVISNNPPMSRIKGRLVYEFQAKTGNSRPLGNRNVSIISCLVTNEPGQVSKIVKNGQYEDLESAFPYVKVLSTSQTDASGNFNFQFPNIDPENPDPISGNFMVSTGKLNREASWKSWESDPETDFRIVYESKNVNVKRVFRLVVDDPTGLFMSPDDNFTIDPLETVDVGTVVSKVMSYQLNGTVGWDKLPEDTGTATYESEGTNYTDPNLNIPVYTPIQNVDCYILRLQSQIDYYQLPADEGQNIVGSIDEKPEFKIVGMTTSNSYGIFSFSNLLFRNAMAPVYLYFKTKDMLGDANFEPVMVNQTCINEFARPVYLFNADYNYSTITGFGSAMLPKLPTLKGKVTSNVSAGKGIWLAKVVARFKFKSTVNNSYFYLERTCITDQDGYYDFKAAFENFENIGFVKKIESVQLTVSKEGFHYMKGNQRQERYVDIFDKTNFELGKQKIVDVILYGNGSINGRIVNEQNEPVDAYVQFLENRIFDQIGGEGSVATTSSGTGVMASFMAKGEFWMPAIPGNNRKLAIIPKDVAYFPDTILINVLEDGVTNKGDITVYERSHRISFVVKDYKKSGSIYTSKPVPGAKVSLVGSPTPVIAYSNSTGEVTMSFKNVSESNLSLQVSGPYGSGYVPQTISFTNYESDNVVQLPTVYLRKGLTLRGKVLLDGNPTPDAEIYIELSKNTQTNVSVEETSQGENAYAEAQYLFKTHSKSDGSFEINTIPHELEGKQIIVKAVYKKNNYYTSSMIGGSSSHATNENNNPPAKTKNSSNASTTVNTHTGTTVNTTHTNTSASGTANSNEKPGGGQGLVEVNNNATINVQEIPTVIGDQKLISIGSITSNVELNLKTFDQMQIKDLWGFPIEITKLTPQTNGQRVYVSGRVNLNGYCPGFDPLEPLTLEVEHVAFEPSSKVVNGKPVGEVAQNNVVVYLKRDFKMKYAKAFNVKLRSPANALFTISKDDENEGKGQLNASVSIVDNSFQYPSSYLNFEGVNFNFCTPIPRIFNAFNPIINVFNASTPGNGNTPVKFHLCNMNSQEKAEDLIFSFINFETHSKVSDSYVEGDEIILSPTLKAQMKDAGDIDIKIGKLVLKNNTIAAVSGNNPISIELKDEGIYDAAKAWKFEVNNWRIDPKAGGLVSENCMLRTGAIDIPYSYFNLRSDFAYLGEPDLKNLKMGGYPIQLSPTSSASGPKVVTGFNASCGSDKKGHWQLIIYPSPNGYAPATVNVLPNMNNVPLELETVSLLSNGENVFTIGTGAKKMRLYKTVEFRPQSAFSLSDGLVLSGIADFNIPRVRDLIGARLTFVHNAEYSTNPKFDPIDLGFEGKGNIKFEIAESGQAFNVNARTFTTYGIAYEPGVLAPIGVKLTYFDNDVKNLIRTEIVQSPLETNHIVKIGSSNTRLEHVTCKTSADQNDWDLFTFEGELTGAKGVADDANKHMKFTVHGEIKGEQNDFKADGVNHNFNGIQTTYQNGRVIGTLQMDNVPLGSARVTGVANMLMDKDGWAFYSNCRAIGVQAPETCTLYMGMLIGDYPKLLPEMSSTVLAYSINKTMPSSFSEGVKGFYMVGGRELPISGLDVGVDVVVASAYVAIPQAALDVAFYGNFANGTTTLGLGLTGGLKIKFGLGSITCTDLYGDGSATASVTGEYTNDEFNLKGGADFTAGLTVKQGIPYGFGCKDAVSITVPPINGGFTFNANPFDVNFYIK